MRPPGGLPARAGSRCRGRDDRGCRARAASYEVRWVSRRLPRGVRHAAVVGEITRPSPGPTSSTRPAWSVAPLRAPPLRDVLVVKLVADEAYERARRRRAGSGARLGRVSARRRRRTCASAPCHARRGAAPGCARLLPERLPPRGRARLGPRPGARLGAEPRAARPCPPRAGRPRASSGGRPDAGVRRAADRSEGARRRSRRGGRSHRASRSSCSARARAVEPGAPHRGTSPRRPRPLLARLNARRCAVPVPGRRRVAALVRWENLPHTVVEALAVGTPVDRDGGRRRRRDRPRRRERPARPARRRRGARRRDAASHEDGLRDRLAAAAAPSVEPLAEAACSAGGGGALPGGGVVRRRLLMAGRTRYAMPLRSPLARKFDALEQELDVRVLAAAATREPAPTRRRSAVPRSCAPLPAIDGLRFYLRFPFLVAREPVRMRPTRCSSRERRKPRWCFSAAGSPASRRG